MHSPGTVIAGAGQAGFQTAAALRTEGYEHPITLIGEEPGLPYYRPPLSKGFLSGKDDRESLPLRPREFYEEHRIRLLMGDRVVEMTPGARQVRLESGLLIEYEYLVLATGARVRPIPGAPEGVCYLRTLEDAAAIRERLQRAQSLAIVGAGFIGLEVAGAAASAGLPVTIVAAEDRPMSRVVSPPISAYFARLHESRGVGLRLGAPVDRITRESGSTYRIFLRTGEHLSSELVVAGIGVIPNTSLAAEAGLATGDGIRVDQYLRTSDSNIFAIGDCAEHPNRFAGGALCRLESVQNAVDQARCAASAIAGKPRVYGPVPWFWTEQFDQKLQIAGIPAISTEFVSRGDPATQKFSVFGFSGEVLQSVESVNRPADHMLARKLLDTGSGLLTPAQAADVQVDLKAILR
jgi:3-phenylpropionate/trans-cinnamate dioxygenase ferredoxin reductase component